MFSHQARQRDGAEVAMTGACGSEVFSEVITMWLEQQTLDARHLTTAHPYG